MESVRILSKSYSLARLLGLREAEREHKLLEEIAGEAIMRGLSSDRDAEWRKLIAFAARRRDLVPVRQMSPAKVPPCRKLSGI